MIQSQNFGMLKQRDVVSRCGSSTVFLGHFSLTKPETNPKKKSGRRPEKICPLTPPGESRFPTTETPIRTVDSSLPARG
jgi:hypothetical protein